MVSGTSYQQTRDSIGSEPDNFPIALRYYRNLSIYSTVRATIQDISGGFILGSTNYGLINVTIPSVPISSNILHSVTSQNNLFYDNLDTDDYINDSNSTGTSGSTDYTLLTGEILQSEIIAMNEKVYLTATLKITGTDIDDDALYLSGNGGTNWEVVTNGIEHTFTNTSTDGIKYKIDNSAVGASFPTPFGTWGSLIGGSTSIINTIKIKYS
jgi:hypothetical protein